jgi:soluble lytic murein transglycosylase-like protein
MLKLTVLTAALAAGVMSIAATVAHSAPLSPRADTTPTINRSAVVQKAEKPKKAQSAKGSKAEKATVKKAKKQTVAQKKTFKKKSVVAGNKIDFTTTASIGPKRASQPATARGGAPYSTIVARYAASYGVPVSLAHAVIKIESNYRANARGSAGEVGLMQIKPATARMLGYSGSAKGLYDPETNIKYGMKYLAMAQDLGGGTTCGTILKYNAGHAAKRMNPVSRAYCAKVKRQIDG